MCPGMCIIIRSHICINRPATYITKFHSIIKLKSYVATIKSIAIVIRNERKEIFIWTFVPMSYSSQIQIIDITNA